MTRMFETTDLSEFVELMATTATDRERFFRDGSTVSRSYTASSYNFCLGFVQRLNHDERDALMSKLEANALVLFAEGFTAVVGRRRDASYKGRVKLWCQVCIVQTALYDYMCS